MAKHIKHIPEILYFWRAHEKSVVENIAVKQYAVDAGFGNNIETYNRVENPTFWQKIGSAVGLADTRKDVIKKEIEDLKKELSELDVNSEEYKALQDRLGLLVNEYEEVSNTWYESFGNFVETAVVNPVKSVFGFMTGSWLKPLKDWMFGDKKKKEEEEKDQGGPRITESASKAITEIPEEAFFISYFTELHY